MKIERLDRVVLFAETGKFEETKTFFESLFDVNFDEPVVGREAKGAYSSLGLELAERFTPSKFRGLWAIVLKVPDLDEAIGEMEVKGLRLRRKIEIGQLREAVFNPEDSYDVTIVLCEYPAPVHPATAAAAMK